MTAPGANEASVRWLSARIALEALATEAVYEFLFVAAPLKIEGGARSPVRAFALA